MSLSLPPRPRRTKAPQERRYRTERRRPARSAGSVQTRTGSDVIRDGAGSMLAKEVGDACMAYLRRSGLYVGRWNN